jgi:hypothetical protein
MRQSRNHDSSGDVNRRTSNLLRSPLGLSLLNTLATANATARELSAVDLSRMAIQCRVDLSPWRTDYQQVVDGLWARRSALRPIADQLAKWPAVNAWWSDLDRQNQIWTSTLSVTPSSERLQLDLSPYGHGVSKPRRAFWTSTLLEQSFSGWVEWTQVGEDRLSGPYQAWLLRVDPSARVFEIHSAEDWRELVRHYRNPTADDSANPNWNGVAAEWEGVHLSTGGLLTGEGVRLDQGGLTIMLQGWNVESTLWFRWAFQSRPEIAFSGGC